ncbi:MAG: hypothetical protein JO041_07185 [Acidobacteria bacterium]|nr:hypothetical protein [Acidobacteriota bacterium]
MERGANVRNSHQATQPFSTYEEHTMTSMMALTIAAAGLVFSLSLALLIEELIVGAVFRLFFGKSYNAPGSHAQNSGHVSVRCDAARR